MPMRSAHRLLTTVALLATTSQAHASLIVNGGLEGGPSGLVTSIPTGSSALPGWTYIGGNGVTYARSGWTFPPSEGDACVLLAGDFGPGTIGQTLTLTPGQRYRIEFDAASQQGAFGEITITADLRELGSFPINWTSASWQPDWRRLSLEFTAMEAEVHLSFSARLRAGVPFGVPGIDNISLVAVPAPATAAMLGFAIITGLRRRR